MPVEIRQEPATPATLAAYARVPIAFEVAARFGVLSAEGPGRWVLTERPVTPPYVKDYDQTDGGPTSWAARFDVALWTLLIAEEDGRRVGGAVAAPGTAELGGSAGEAVLWDIRVAAEARGRGIGTALFQAAERFCVGQGCSGLRAETQDVNVAACRFYARQGCVLHAVERTAYPQLPDEVRMIWRKDLYA
jgi:GNAT superfamily N-acetyltransferase